MSAQGYEYWQRLSDNKEIESREKKARADEDAKWRVQTMLASQKPSGSDRIIDWRRM
jgi:hypothetical protein